MNGNELVEIDLGMIPDRKGDGFVDVEADGIPYFLKGDGHLILDGLYGEVEDLGYFLVFKSVFLDQFEDDLAFWGKLVDGLLDQGEHVGGDHELFRVEVDAGEFCVEFVEGVCAVAFLVTEIIEGSVAGGDVEVDLDVVDLFEIAAFLPDADKYVGNDLFRGFFGFDHGFGEEEQRGVEGCE